MAWPRAASAVRNATANRRGVHAPNEASLAPQNSTEHTGWVARHTIHEGRGSDPARVPRRYSRHTARRTAMHRFRREHPETWRAIHREW